ncbi:hypothetical protein BKH42_06220 [Helicobacter sp. 13S00482-2]|uniref:hypothetical protein n=1 Tax=Helicobacter sp. 13S00482-2 TaxID=1476200 RepID=UPI000BA580F2|nr:hypothetical protein [Helicobacter sp. 13S00482-2]PAF53407.1 hypothetical protein BKH42_06220 [Helicobacter sp. 13S00482-2]
MRVALTVFLFLGILGAQNAFINKTTALKVNDKVVGEITTLTPVQVIQIQGSKAKIKLKGFVDENYTKIVQRSPELGEVYAILDKNNSTFLKTISKKENDYGDLWLEVEGEFEVDKSMLDMSNEALNQKAKDIYEKTCSQCHRLHSPDDFTVNQWPSNISSMKDMVSLDKDTKELITKYLQQNAKDTKNQ